MRHALLASLYLLLVAGPAMAQSGADTEHMFGFTDGSDIGRRGETEGEIETIGRFGRLADAYSAISTNFEVKHVVIDRLRVAGALALYRFDVVGFDGQADQHRFTFDRLSLEFRAQVLDRGTQPIGLTLIATPFLGFVDPSTGAAGERHGANWTIAIDRELVTDKLFAALNLGYNLERDRSYATGSFADGSSLSINLASVTRLVPWLYVGAETRYQRTYDGLTLRSLTGQAVYVGPVIYLPIARRLSLSGAWNIQAWGQAAGVGGGLDLANFEGHQMKLRLSVSLN